MKNRSQGYTLVELMTAILILAVLVAIAVPSFRSFAANSRVSAAAGDLVLALNYARSEALRRATNVQVCASTDEASCSGSDDWSTGWIVYADLNGNASPDGGEVLQTWPALQAQVSLTADVGSATYDSLGMARLPGGASTATFLTAHPACKDQGARQSVLALSGSLQTGPTACPAE